MILDGTVEMTSAETIAIIVGSALGGVVVLAVVAPMVLKAAIPDDALKVQSSRKNRSTRTRTRKARA